MFENIKKRLDDEFTNCYSIEDKDGIITILFSNYNDLDKFIKQNFDDIVKTFGKYTVIKYSDNKVTIYEEKELIKLNEEKRAFIDKCKNLSFTSMAKDILNQVFEFPVSSFVGEYCGKRGFLLECKTQYEGRNLTQGSNVSRLDVASLFKKWIAKKGLKVSIDNINENDIKITVKENDEVVFDFIDTDEFYIVYKATDYVYVNY